jgi:cell volume regulation protein A
MSENLALALLVGALVVLASALAVRVSTRLGLPSLLVYLGLGVVLGESVIGLRFDDAELTRILGICALVIILAEGGLTTRWVAVRDAVPRSILLSTLGVAVSIAVTGGVAVLALDISWRTGFLLGAVVSSTDAAAVFSTLRGLGLPRRVTATLELESGLNDAPVVILVVLLSSDTLMSLPAAGLLLVYELVAGAAIGIGIGVVGAWVLRRSALPASGLYPLATIAFCVLAYAGADVAHASGFLAVYVAGLVLGNARLPHRRAMLGFAEGLAWLSQIGLFVLLGLLVSPPRLPEVLVPAVGARVDGAVSGSAAGAGLCVLGWSAGCRPDRFRHHPGHRGGARCSADLRHRLRARRRLHPGAGDDPARGRQKAWRCRSSRDQ